MKIWCNARLAPAAARRLEEGLKRHELLPFEGVRAAGMTAGTHDPAFAAAEVAFGLPYPADVLTAPRLRWFEITTAGYARYDRTDLREALLAKGSAFTNASLVYAEACSQHLLAMMLALGRGLLQSYEGQRTDRPWPFDERRASSRLLTGQTVVMLGYGAIGRRLAELLAPFGMRLFALRRRIQSESAVRIVPEEDLTRVLALADHLVNILPENESTRHFVNARRLECCPMGVRFYNVGRGGTVDQPALLAALESGRVGAAYLDVMEPEPLPPSHPLWSAPNCYLTPHSAGGRHDQDDALVAHFLDNLGRFERGEALLDRIL